MLSGTRKPALVATRPGIRGGLLRADVVRSAAGGATGGNTGGAAGGITGRAIGGAIAWGMGTAAAGTTTGGGV